MMDKSMVNAIQLLENQKIEREIALYEALDERKRAFELARLQYSYPYKALGSFLVTLISGVSAYRHKNMLHLIPIAVALPYLACETDASFGRKTERIRSRANLLYRKRMAEHEPYVLVTDVKQRLRDLREDIE